MIFDEETGFPPPGRRRLTVDEAEAALVSDEQFAKSTTRADLWEGFERYVARFLALEERYRELLDGRELLHAFWLGGSFASAEINPRNIDVTVIVDGTAREAIKGNLGAKWLTDAFNRDRIARDFGLSPLELIYWPVVSVFRPTLLVTHERDYLQARGGWDDWWQRRRIDGASPEPSLDTVHVRRGYLEVVL